MILLQATTQPDFTAGIATLITAITGLLIAVAGALAAAASVMSHIKSSGRLGALEGQMNQLADRANVTAAAITSHDGQLTSIAGNVAAAVNTANAIKATVVPVHKVQT